ncbi:MAG: HU family DNA-binding protein [Fuerstiella sp.]
MTKKEIVKAISEELGLTQLKTRDIVQRTFDMIVDTLVTDGRIELRNFGVFEVKKRAARKARNPRTGDSVEVPSRFVVTFKPGKEMEERVLLMEQAEQRLAWEIATDDDDAGQTTAVNRPQNGHSAAPINPNGLPPLREEVEYRPPAGPAPRPQGGS